MPSLLEEIEMITWEIPIRVAELLLALLFVLGGLATEDVVTILNRAVSDPVRGFGAEHVDIHPETVSAIAQ